MGIKRVLVPVSGAKSDDEAVKLSCDIARGERGKVFALYVIQVPLNLPLDAEIASETAKGEEVLEHIERLGKEYRCEVEAEILQARGAGEAVVQEAVEREVDLIVAGMPYMKPYGVFSPGDLVPYLLKNAPCQVLVWREAMSESDRPQEETS